MLSMQIDSLVGTLVRQLLIEDALRQGDRALHFHFDLRMGNYTEGKDYGASRALHLLYQLPPGSSYVSAFSAVLPSPFDKIDKVRSWKHESTHDSCWRDIRVFSETYFAMAQQINARRVADGLPEVAPITMSENNAFQLFGRAWDWVSVDISKDPTDSSNYRRVVQVRQ